MKRATLFFLSVTTASSCLFAQTTKNPFSELGYKKQITYTSSKGEFEEFHDNADVVEIGSVYFNTKMNKVVGYVNEVKENAEVATATSAMSVDPLCEKYYWISPYAFCLNNPVRFIDPDGRVVKPADQEALKMIQNTLTTEDIKYVQFDKDGNIDRDLINSRKSESGNFNSLLGLVNSDIITNVSHVEGDITYTDNNGNSQPMTMPYIAADPEFADPNGVTSAGTSTGEAGRIGVTLLPGRGESGVNSPDATIKVYINKLLSPAAQAEAYSHEANGHALIYVETKDRKQSGHIYEGSRDTNQALKGRIIKSKQETITNMRSR